MAQSGQPVAPTRDGAATGHQCAFARTTEGVEATMPLAAAETTEEQVNRRTGREQRACPVCGGKLRTVGARRWGCEAGHTVAYAPGLSDGRNRVKLGWAEGASHGADLRRAEQVRPRTKSQREGPSLPLPAGEDIAASKAEWERRLKRERQRRWRARKRAGLV